MKRIHILSLLLFFGVAEASAQQEALAAPGIKDLDPEPKTKTAEMADTRLAPDWLKLRRSVNDLAKDESALGETDGALFSFSHNYDSDTDQWIARGIFGIDFGSWEDGAASGTIAFDKVSTAGSDADEVDSLSFGLGVEGVLRNISNRSPDNIWWRLSVNADTDFDFDQLAVGGSLDIVPEFTSLAMNTYSGGNLIGYHFDLALHADFGAVTDVGDNAGLIEESYGHIGGRAGLTIYPGGTRIQNRLALSVAYLHYETLGSDMESPNIFEASARFQPVPDKPVFLSVAYRNGTIAKTLEEDDTLTVGLSVAF